MNQELVKRHYTFFRLAVGVCLAGVLTISVLSYYIANKNLHKNIQHALEDAVIAMQELTIDSDAVLQILSGSTNAPDYLDYKERLERFLARSQDVSVVGIAMRTAGGEPFFLAAEKDSPNHNPPEYLREILLSLTEDGRQHPRKEFGGAAHPELLHLDFTAGGKVHASASCVPLENGATLVYYAVQMLDSLQSQRYAHLLLEGTQALFCILAVTLAVVFYAMATKATVSELNSRNTKLEEELQLQKTKEQKLREIIHDSERFNALTLRREERIIQLKSEVNELLARMQQEKRYNVDKMD